MCCSEGKVVILQLEEPAEPSKELFSLKHGICSTRLKNIIHFLHDLIWARNEYVTPGFSTTFTVQGQSTIEDGHFYRHQMISDNLRRFILGKTKKQKQLNVV